MACLAEFNAHAEELREVAGELFAAREVHAADKLGIGLGESLEEAAGFLALTLSQPGEQQQRARDDKREVAEAETPGFKQGKHAASMEAGEAGCQREAPIMSASGISASPKQHRKGSGYQQHRTTWFRCGEDDTIEIKTACWNRDGSDDVVIRRVDVGGGTFDEEGKTAGGHVPI